MSYEVGRNVDSGRGVFVDFKKSDSAPSIYALPGLRYRDPLPYKVYGPNLKAERIIALVLSYYCMEREDVFRKSRKREVVLSRQVMHYLIKMNTKLTLKQIGELVSGKRALDHTTVMHSIATVKDLMATDPDFKQAVLQIQQSI